MDISDLVTFKPFSRKVRVTSANSPALSSVQSSSLTPCHKTTSFICKIPNCIDFEFEISVRDNQEKRANRSITSDALLSIAAIKHRITRCFSASELIGVPSACLMKNSCNQIQLRF